MSEEIETTNNRHLMQIVLTEQEHESLKRLAAEQRTSMSKIVRSGLRRMRAIEWMAQNDFWILTPEENGKFQPLMPVSVALDLMI